MAEYLGRSSIQFDVQQAAELLFELRLSATRVAEILGISRTTLYQKMAEEGLDLHTHKYSSISDDDLQEEIKTIIAGHPNAGEVYITGHLRSRSIFVQRQRIRNFIRLIDPIGVSQRKTNTVSRRIYNVPCPNYLWHIDGAHKMIMWKFVVHAAIDGFSRSIVYLHCANNNKSSTVQQLFLSAIDQYGWPLRVRTDYGGENVGVWEQMEQYRGADKKPVIAGSSVHNSRVERLHRDVNIQVCHKFKTTFLQMEEEGILDRNNETDIFCLHYVFLPNINQSLTEFRNAHNHHSISTENNQTPMQLFHLNQNLLHTFQSQENIDSHPGISVGDLRVSDLPHVHVEHISSPLSRRDLRALREIVDPLSPGNLVTKYKQVSEFVFNCLSSTDVPS